MLITIRRRWLLRVFGWGQHAGQSRKPDEYPSYVIASHKLWWFWVVTHFEISPPGQALAQEGDNAP